MNIFEKKLRTAIFALSFLFIGVFSWGAVDPDWTDFKTAYDTEDYIEFIEAGIMSVDGDIGLPYSASLTIYNPLAGTVTFSGNGANIAGFEFDEAKTAYFNGNFKFTNFKREFGGGFLLAGSSVTFIGSSIEIASNTASKNGGGMYLVNSGLYSSIVDFYGDIISFKGNIAEGDASVGAGGAVYLSQSTITFASTKMNFIGNKAKQGAVLFAENDSWVVFKDGDVSFEDNITSVGDGIIAWSERSTVSFTNLKSLTAVNNKAVNGGFLSITGEKYTLGADVINISSNIVTGDGGGIKLNNSTITFVPGQSSYVNVTFSGNSATGLGGAIYANNKSHVELNAVNGQIIFSGNTAGGKPNDIYLDDSSLELITTAANNLYLLSGITGGGSSVIHKRNVGDLFVGGINNYWGNFTIEQGKVILKANFATLGNLSIGVKGEYTTVDQVLERVYQTTTTVGDINIDGHLSIALVRNTNNQLVADLIIATNSVIINPLTSTLSVIMNMDNIGQMSKKTRVKIFELTGNFTQYDYKFAYFVTPQDFVAYTESDTFKTYLVLGKDTVWNQFIRDYQQSAKSFTLTGNVSVEDQLDWDAEERADKDAITIDGAGHYVNANHLITGFELVGNNLTFANIDIINFLSTSTFGGAITATEGSYLKLNTDSAKIVFSGNRTKVPFIDSGISLFGLGDDVWENDTFVTSATLHVDATNNNILFADGVYVVFGSTVIKTGKAKAILNGGNVFSQMAEFDIYEGGMIFDRSTMTYIDSSTHIFIARGELKFSNSQANFIRNTVISSGGAINIDIVKQVTSTVTFIGSTATFLLNKAYDGGAIASLSSVTVGRQRTPWHGILIFENSNINFSSNTALNDGGVIYSSGAAFDFKNSLVNFTSNVAEKNGGALYIRNGSRISFSGSQVNFTSNMANIGGAIFSTQSVAIVFDNSKVNFIGNKATEVAGVINVGKGSSITFNGLFGATLDDNSTIVNLTSNSADSAGAILVEKGGYIGFNSVLVSFTSNSAGVMGGAIVIGMDNSNINFSSSAVNFIANRAEKSGGAVYAADLSSINFTTSVVTFIGNSAKERGGAIFVDNSISVGYGKINFRSSTVSFTSSTAQYGGAVAVKGENSIIDFSRSIVNFTSNSAVEDGGAIEVSDNAKINFSSSNVNFIGNKAVMLGGAILSGEANVNFSSSVVNFTSNSAQTGGALYVTNGGKISFDNSIVKFTSNAAQTVAAMYVTDNSTASFSGEVEFNYNKTLDGNGVIYLNANSKIDFTSSSIKIVGNSALNGGFLYLNDGVEFEFNGNKIEALGNRAVGSAGMGNAGVIGIDNSTLKIESSTAMFSGNKANQFGGVIAAVNGATVTFNSSMTFLGNTAVSSGGAIYANLSSITFQTNYGEVVFSGNLVGAILASAQNNAIFIDESILTLIASKEKIKIYDGMVAVNQSTVNVSGSTEVYLSNINKFGDINFNLTGILTVDKASYTYIDSRAMNIQQASATYINSKVNFERNTDGTLGGAMYVSNSTVDFINSKLDFIENEATQYGGVIFAQTSKINIDRSTVNFIENNSAQQGGVLFIANASELIISNSSVNFITNTASAYAGAMAIVNGAIGRIDRSTLNFIHNESVNENAGALGIDEGAQLFVNRSEINFTSNMVGDSGGAVGVRKAQLSFDNSNIRFTSNTAVNYGGAFIAYYGATATFASSTATFINNGAQYGGGVFIIESEVNFSSSIVNLTKNTASIAGGAIYSTTSANISFYSSTVNFTSNTALASGGAIYNELGSNISFSSSIVNFTSNSAGTFGGTIYNIQSSISFNNSTVSFLSNSAERGAAISSRRQGEISFNNSSVSFTNNTAIKNALGGAIDNGDGSTMSFSGSKVEFTRNKASYGGAIYNGKAEINFSSSIVKFTSNVANNIGGGMYITEAKVNFNSSIVDFTSNTAGNYGGAMFVTGAGSEINFRGSTISFINNTATIGGAIAVGDNIINIKFDGGKVDFIGNKSFSGNGIVHLGANATIDFEGKVEVNAIKNEALNGGFLYLDGKSVTFAGIVNIDGNKATGFKAESNVQQDGKGGALYLTGDSVVVFEGKTTTISNNETNSNWELGQGGAIYLEPNSAASIDFNNTHLIAKGNKTNSDGGFIYLVGRRASAGDVVFSSTLTITGNTAGQRGGAFYVKDTDIVFDLREGRNMVFSENSASYRGGVIYLDEASSLVISAKNKNTSILFKNNKALEGGVIFADNSSIEMIADDGGAIVFESNIRTNPNVPKSNDIVMGENVNLILNSITTGTTGILLGGGIAIYKQADQQGNIITKIGNGEAVIKGVMSFSTGVVVVEQGTLRIEADVIEIGSLMINAGTKYSMHYNDAATAPTFARHTTTVSTATISGNLEIGVNAKEKTADKVYGTSTVFIDVYTSTLSIKMNGGFGAAKNIIVVRSNVDLVAEQNPFGVILMDGNPILSDSKYDYASVEISTDDRKVAYLEVLHSMEFPDIPGLNHSELETAKLLDKSQWDRWTGVKKYMNPILFNAANGDYDYARKALTDLNGTFTVNAIKSGIANRNMSAIFSRVAIEIEEFGYLYEDTGYDEIWVQSNLGGLELSEENDPANKFVGYNYGMQAGANIYTQSGVIMGIFVGYNGSRFEQDNNKANMIDMEMGLYGGWFGDRINVKAMLSGGQQNFDITRNVRYFSEFDETGRTSQINPQSKFDTKTIKAAGEIEYAAYKSKYLSIKPFVGMESGVISNSKIKEQEGQEVGLTIKEGQYSRVEGKFGLKVEDNFGDLRWNIRGYGQYLIRGNEAGYDISFTQIDYEGTMNIWGQQEPDLTMGLGAGIKYSLTPTLTLGLDFNTNFATEKFVYNTGLGLSYKIGYGKKIRDTKLNGNSDLVKNIGKVLSDKRLKWVSDTKESTLGSAQARKELGIEIGDTIYVVIGGDRILYFHERIEAQRFVREVRRVGGDLEVSRIKKVVIEKGQVYPEGSEELEALRQRVVIRKYSEEMKEISGLITLEYKKEKNVKQEDEEEDLRIRTRQEQILDEVIEEERKTLKGKERSKTQNQNIPSGTLVRDQELKIWDLPVNDGNIILKQDLAQELGVEDGSRVFLVKFNGKEYMFGELIAVEEFVAKLTQEGAKVERNAIEVSILTQGLKLPTDRVTGIGKIKKEVVVIKYSNEEIEIMTKEEKKRRDKLEGIN